MTAQPDLHAQISLVLMIVVVLGLLAAAMVLVL
jgi:hypothetical protein